MSTLLDGATIFVNKGREQAGLEWTQGGSVVLSGNEALLNNIIRIPNGDQESVVINTRAQEVTVVKVDTLAGHGPVSNVTTSNGNDIIYVNGSLRAIDSGNGTDIINISQASEIVVNNAANTGVKIVNLQQETSNATVNGGSSVDIINIKAGAGVSNLLRGGAGNDIITVNDGGEHVLEGGSGNDRYIINKLEPGCQYVIDQSTALGSDRDTLYLVKFNSADFNIGSNEQNDYVLEYKNGATIIVRGIENSTLRMTFKDKRITAEQKILNITDVEAHGNIVFKEPAQGTVEGYTFNLIDSTAENVIGAKVSAGSAANNSVNISGCTEVNNVYGAWGEAAALENNRVTVSEWAVVKGDVYANYLASSSGTAGVGYVTISDSAMVNGSIIGLQGKDYIYIDGGFVNEISSGAGDDFIRISGGYVSSVEAGEGDDMLLITAGTPFYLRGDAGNDSYYFMNTLSNDVFIDQGSAGSTDMDMIYLTKYNQEDFLISSDGYSLVLTDKTTDYTITVDSCKNHVINQIMFKDSAIGQSQLEKIIENITPQSVIQDLMYSLDKTRKQGTAAMDEAIAYCSKGKYTSLSGLVNAFIADCREHGGVEYSVKQQRFLEEYCGIKLFNEDTGAITGSDAGGQVVKNKYDIVPEDPSISLEDLVYDTSSYDRIVAPDYSRGRDYVVNKTFYAKKVGNITFYWDESSWSSLGVDVAIMEKIVSGILEVWAEPALDLVEESYGLTLDDPNSTLYTLPDGSRGIQLCFKKEASSNLATAQYYNKTYTDGADTLVYESNEIIWININRFLNGIADINGARAGQSSFYLDRILVHELVHVAMNVNTHCMTSLPTFIKEGLAELVHGVDDDRMNNILGVTASDNTDYLRQVLSDYTSTSTWDFDSYGAGYALLRYLAKQVAEDNIKSTFTPSGNTLKVENINNTSIRRVFGGYAADNIHDNLVGIFGGTGTGQASNNKVTLDGYDFYLVEDAKSTFLYWNFTNFNDVYGGYTLNNDSQGNFVSITNSYVHSGNNDMAAVGGVNGAYAYNGNAKHNSLTVTTSYTNIACGAYVEATTAGYVAEHNSLYLNNTFAYNVAGAVGKGADARDNTLLINNCQYENFVDADFAARIKNANYSCINTVYGARTYGDGKALNNTTEIRDSYVYTVEGAHSENSMVKGNTLSLLGNTEVKFRLYGAYSSSGLIENNTTYISDNAVVMGAVCGGYSSNGDVINNAIYISGNARLKADVQTGYSAHGVMENNRVYVTEAAKVEGTVCGWTSSDVILVGSSNATRVNGDAGDDVIYSLSGKNTLIGGSGSDTFVIDWKDAGGVLISDTYESDQLNVVKLVNAEAEEVNVAKDSSGNLLLSNAAGATLKLANWRTGAYSGIELVSDTGIITYGAAAINSALNQLSNATLAFTDAAIAGQSVMSSLTDEDRKHLMVVSGNF